MDIDPIELQFLKCLYDSSNKGRAAATDQHDVGRKIGLGLDRTDAIVDRLIELGLVCRTGIGGDIAITEEGIALVEGNNA